MVLHVLWLKYTRTSQPPQAGHKVKEKAKVARTNSSWLEMDSFYSLGGLTMEPPMFKKNIIHIIEISRQNHPRICGFPYTIMIIPDIR